LLIDHQSQPRGRLGPRCLHHCWCARRLPEIANHIHLPHIGLSGNFRLRPALSLCLEADMDDPRMEQYLANAKRCEEYAQGSDDRLLANMYEDMARKWRELAAQVAEEVVVAQ